MGSSGLVPGTQSVKTKSCDVPCSPSQSLFQGKELLLKVSSSSGPQGGSF